MKQQKVQTPEILSFVKNHRFSATPVHFAASDRGILVMVIEATHLSLLCLGRMLLHVIGSRLVFSYC